MLVTAGPGITPMKKAAATKPSHRSQCIARPFPCVLENIAAFEMGFNLGAGAPGVAQPMLRQQRRLIGDVRRTGLRGVAVSRQHLGARGTVEADDGDEAVAEAGGAAPIL